MPLIGHSEVVDPPTATIGDVHQHMTFVIILDLCSLGHMNDTSASESNALRRVTEPTVRDRPIFLITQEATLSPTGENCTSLLGYKLQDLPISRLWRAGEMIVANDCGEDAL